MDHSCILSIPLAPGICDKWLQNVLLSFFLTTRARRPALQYDCMETDGKDTTKMGNDKTSSQRKTHIIKMVCAPTARRLEPSKFIRICTCPAEPKSRLNKKVCSLPTAAHFHSDKILSIRTSPLSLFVFIFGREDNPRQSRIRSLR